MRGFWGELTIVYRLIYRLIFAVELSDDMSILSLCPAVELWLLFAFAVGRHGPPPTGEFDGFSYPPATFAAGTTQAHWLSLENVENVDLRCQCLLALKPELFGKMQNSDTAQWRGTAFDALIHGEANRKTHILEARNSALEIMAYRSHVTVARNQFFGENWPCYNVGSISSRTRGM